MKAANPFPWRKSHGFEVLSTAEAVRHGRRHLRRHPRHQAGQAYEKDIAPNLAPGKTLLFSHGFSIHFKTIVPPKDVNVILVAPKGPGPHRPPAISGRQRRARAHRHLSGPGKKSKQVALAWAKGIGATRAGVIQTSFKEETETDLVRRTNRPLRRRLRPRSSRVRNAVEAGYQPEMAYFECLHELKLIVDLMNEAGISGMRFSISETAKWGDVSVGPKIIDAGVKKRMKAALKDIQSGKFAQGWIKEYNGGYKKYNALLKAGQNHPIEKTWPTPARLDAVDEEAFRQRRAGGVLKKVFSAQL